MSWLERTTPRRWWIGACVTTYLVLAIASAAVQAPWWDEAWFASPARNLAFHGHMGTSIIYAADWLAGVNEHTYWVAPLYLVTLAGWIKLVGFGLLRMRLLSVAWGLVALVAWAIVAYRVTGRRRVALIALGLIAVEHGFVTMAAELRMDVMCIALGASALAVYLSRREASLDQAVGVSALLAAAAVVTHPNGIFTLAGLALFAGAYDRQRLRWKHLALALAPFIVGGICWGLYAAQDPSSFVHQLRGNMENRFSGLSHPGLAIYGELWRVSKFYAYGSNWAEVPFRMLARPARDWPLVAPVLLTAGFIGAFMLRAVWRERGLRILMLVALLVTTDLVFFDMHKRSYYIVYLTPLLAVFTAVLADRLLERPATARFALAALAMLVIVSMALDVRGLRYTTEFSGYDRAVEGVRRYAHGGPVIGSSELAFALGFDGRLVDDHTLGMASRLTPDVIVFNRRYHDYLKGTEDPEVVRAFMEHRLASEYRQVDTAGVFSVYVPRTAATKSSP